jgi:hypothetical protein
MADALERSYIRAASSLLRDAIHLSTGIPLPQIQVVQFEATRMAHGPQMVDAPAEILKFMIRPESGYANCQFADCVTQHFGSGLLTRDEAPGQSSQVRSANDRVYHWKLMQPLLQAVEDASSLSLEPNQILIAYRCFKKAWLGQASSEMLIPLSGLEGALSSAVKFERLLLSRFFVPEKNKFARRNHHPQYITFNGIGRSHFKLTSQLSSDDGGDSRWDIQIEAQRIITAFRLALPGRLGARAIFVDAIARAFGGSPGNFAGFEVPEFVVDPIFFSDVDVPNIRKVFLDLRSARAFEPECEIWGSIDRFTDSYHHDTNGDRVLDYAGTLEGCLLRGMTEQKKAKLVAERGSRLIAPEFDPENTKTILRKFFILRNNRAHENWAIADRPLVDKVNGIVRAVLHRFIGRIAVGESKEQIVASLTPKT